MKTIKQIALLTSLVLVNHTAVIAMDESETPPDVTVSTSQVEKQSLEYVVNELKQMDFHFRNVEIQTKEYFRETDPKKLHAIISGLRYCLDTWHSARLDSMIQPLKPALESTSQDSLKDNK